MQPPVQRNDAAVHASAAQRRRDCARVRQISHVSMSVCLDVFDVGVQKLPRALKIPPRLRASLSLCLPLVHPLLAPWSTRLPLVHPLSRDFLSQPLGLVQVRQICCAAPVQPRQCSGEPAGSCGATWACMAVAWACMAVACMAVTQSDLLPPNSNIDTVIWHCDGRIGTVI